MTTQDRIVACVLGAGALLGLLVWKELSPWAALAVLLATLVAAAAVYRAEPPLPPAEREPERVPAESDVTQR